MSNKQATYTPLEQTNWCGLKNLYYNEKYTFSKRPSDESYWIFRGDKKKRQDKGAPNQEANKNILRDDDLRTHLEQAFDNFGVSVEEWQRLEIGLIRKFQRKARLYIEHMPEQDDILE